MEKKKKVVVIISYRIIIIVAIYSKNGIVRDRDIIVGSESEKKREKKIFNFSFFICIDKNNCFTF